jgi:hypothetical protein
MISLAKIGLFSCFAATVVCVGAARLCTLAMHARVLRRGTIPGLKMWTMWEDVARRHAELYPDSSLDRWRSRLNLLTIAFFAMFLAFALYSAIAPKVGRRDYQKGRIEPAQANYRSVSGMANKNSTSSVTQTPIQIAPERSDHGEGVFWFMPTRSEGGKWNGGARIRCRDVRCASLARLEAERRDEDGDAGQQYVP